MRRHGYRRAARGAAWDGPAVEGVDGSTEVLVEARGTEGELEEVRLANKPCPVGTGAPHAIGVHFGGSNAVGHSPAPGRRRHTGNVDNVLHRQHGTVVRPWFEPRDERSYRHNLPLRPLWRTWSSPAFTDGVAGSIMPPRWRRFGGRLPSGRGSCS